MSAWFICHWEVSQSRATTATEHLALPPTTSVTAFCRLVRAGSATTSCGTGRQMAAPARLHWYCSAPPVAVTVNVAFPPAATVALAGWTVMAGATWLPPQAKRARASEAAIDLVKGLFMGTYGLSGQALAMLSVEKTTSQSEMMKLPATATAGRAAEVTPQEVAIRPRSSASISL